MVGMISPVYVFSVYFVSSMVMSSKHSQSVSSLIMETDAPVSISILKSLQFTFSMAQNADVFSFSVSPMYS